MRRQTRFPISMICTILLLVPFSAGADEDNIRLLAHDWEPLYKPGQIAEFGERFMHRGAVLGDRMFISGGYNADDMFLGDVWSSVDGTDWRCDVKEAPWSARFAHGMVALDDTLYLMGGYDSELLNDVWKSTDGANWELVTESAGWSPRTHFQAVAHEGAIYVLGGKGRPERHADVWMSTDGAQWTLLNDNAWPARSHFGAASHNGQIVILGGGYFDFEKIHHFYHQDTWSSPDGREWTLLNSNVPMERRVLMELVSVGTHLYAIGGDNKPWFTFMQRDAWTSTDGVDWMKLRYEKGFGQRRRLEYELRIDHVLLAKDDAIYIIGGHDAYSGTYNVTHRFGHWTIANVWKSTGEHHPQFKPEYGPKVDPDESLKAE